MKEPLPAPRVRQDRAIANDVRILDSAVAILANDGWEDASVLRVAEGAGLSRRPVLNRYGDRVGLTSQVWSQRLAAPLIGGLNAVLAATVGRNAALLSHALQPFLDPPPELRAAAEVLIVASFQPEVHQAVHSDLHGALTSWLIPIEGSPSSAQAARNGTLIALALGFLIEARSYPDGLDMDLTAPLEQISHALSRDETPQRLPETRATFLDEEPVLDSDPGMAAMLAATLRLVGRDGYEAATIDRIAAECGRTSGFIFGHYANKRDLFLDATGRLLTQAERNSFEFQSRIAERTSWGIADATMLREIMRPEHRQVRTITLVQYRLSWHDEGIRAAFQAPRATAVGRIMQEDPLLSESQAWGRAFIGLARGIGYGMLAQLHPDAYALPMDVVSVPLIDG